MSETKQEGITAKKAENFDEWYTQVILKSELADYSPVSGCLVYRPSGYAIWEKIQRRDRRRVQEGRDPERLLPALHPGAAPQEGAGARRRGSRPEVAWVTEAGNSKLEERLAVRPTSETIIYEVVRRWIRSWRDLPLRLNLWNNVVQVGVQAPHAVPAGEGVPLERGAHDVRDQGGGRRGAGPDTGDLQEDNRGVPGAAGPAWAGRRTARSSPGRSRATASST